MNPFRIETRDGAITFDELLLKFPLARFEVVLGLAARGLASERGFDVDIEEECRVGKDVERRKLVEGPDHVQGAFLGEALIDECAVYVPIKQHNRLGLLQKR